MSKGASTFQIILLSAFGALGVAAVMIFALATAGQSGSALQPVTMWGTLDANTMKEVLRAASEQDSRLLQVTYVQQDPSTYEATIANALASGKGPDLFLLRDDEALYDESKVYTIPYTSLSSSQFQSAFVDAANPYLSQGGVLGLPVLVDPLVLYWNKDSLASAGFAQPPQYWDQLPSMVQALVQKDDAGVVQKAGIALGTYSNIGAAKDILSMLIEQAGGQITMLNTAGQLTLGLSQSGGASAPAQQALQFYTEFANPSVSSYTWNDAQIDARQEFAAGNLAMYIGYASEYPLIYEANPNLNFGVAAVPQVRSAPHSFDEGVVYALAIPKNDPKLQSAMTIAYLLASEPVDQALAQGFGIAPARRDAISAGPQISTTTAPTNDAPSQSLFYNMALIVKTWYDPDPSQTGPIFQAMIENTESGAAQVSDAIGQAGQQISQLLDRLQTQ